MIERTASGPHGAASALFSDCERYRYLLTRRWDDRPLVAFLLLNPSTADAASLDPTCRRCLGLARREGAGGFAILNLFALRATDPRVMKAAEDPVGPDNDSVIHHAVHDCAYVVAAWGTHGCHRNRDNAVKRRLAAAGVDVYRLGEPTADGHPRHPLYVRGDAPLARFL